MKHLVTLLQNLNTYACCHPIAVAGADGAALWTTGNPSGPAAPHGSPSEGPCNVTATLPNRCKSRCQL